MTLIVIFVGCANKKSITNDNIYNKAFQIIIKVDSSKSIINSKISNELIPFNLESVYSGIIQKNYIHDYEEIKEYDSSQIKYINRVIDSLSEKSKIYNKDFIKNKQVNIDYKFERFDNKTKNVVFFSEIRDNFLYGEVRKYDSKINSISADSKELSYGKVYSFLFRVGNLKDLELIADGHYYMN